MSAIHYSDSVKKILTKVPILRFSRRKCAFIGMVGFLILAFYLTILIFWLRWPDLEVDKCPACYGIDRCPAMDDHDGYIHLWGTSVFEILSIMLSVKNVYYDYHHRFIAKKLAHDWELKAFDLKVCHMLGLEDGCDFSGLNNVPDLREKITDLVTLKPESGASGMTLCPTTEGLDVILNPTYQKNNDSTNRAVTMANIWTIMNINPEPIILQYFNYDGKWPVTKYEGACGRFSLQRSAGKMLSTQLGQSWLFRAEIAIQLLKSADDFTFQHPRFRFYLTDISTDNIVIKTESSLEVSFIDLENMIIVDKQTSSPPTGWEDMHSSEVIACPGCFAFSAQEICAHHLSDHNHYSICRLLQDDLLHSTPNFILQASPQLPEMVKQCVDLTKKSPNRFAASKMLSVELNTIINTFRNHN